LIDARKDCVIRATNLESALEVALSADVAEKGAVAVPAAVLSQTLRFMGSQKITLTSEGGNLLVEVRGSRTLIKAVPHDEFPKIPVSAVKKEINIGREQLLKGLQSVSYAASNSMIRPELGSIYMHCHAAKIVFVATDSFRLAEKKIGGSPADEADVLTPLKHAAELAYVLERLTEDSVDVVVDESQLAVSAGGLRFVSRVVDGNFPNYQEIIPKAFVTQATVLKNDFAEMLKKARIFSGGEQHVGLHVYPKKKIFSATAQASDVGEMSDSIDAALEGEDIDIKFHVRYLSECIPSIDSDSVALEFSGAGKPLVIRGVSDSSFTYLVMPLNR